MKIENNTTLKPNNKKCSIIGKGSEWYANIQGQLNAFQEILDALKQKVDGRDTYIKTDSIDVIDINASEDINTKNLAVTNTASIQGELNANIANIDTLNVLNDFVTKLLHVADLFANTADIEEADIKSAIIDVLRIIHAIKRFDTNQEVISFPSEYITQIGDIANSLLFAGVEKPTWNGKPIAIDSEVAQNYFNKTEINEIQEAELTDSIQRETDIIKGNTPVQKVSAGCVDTDGNILATADDSFMLYGSQGRDNIARGSSLDSLVICGQYTAWKTDLANSITSKPEKETGPFDVIVGYSITDNSLPYQVYVGVEKKTMYIRFFNKELREFSNWQQFQFMGGSTSRPLDVGNDGISLKPEYENELNIYGSSTAKNLIFGKRGNKKDVYTFGENASAEVQAKKFTQNGKAVADVESNVSSATTHKAITISGMGLKINELNNTANVYGNIYTGLGSDWADEVNLPPNASGAHGFCLEILPNKSNTVQKYTFNKVKKIYTYLRIYDNNTWTDWVEAPTLDEKGYVEKAKTADNLNANAKLDGKGIATDINSGVNINTDETAEIPARTWHQIANINATNQYFVSFFISCKNIGLRQILFLVTNNYGKTPSIIQLSKWNNYPLKIRVDTLDTGGEKSIISFYGDWASSNTIWTTQTKIIPLRNEESTTITPLNINAEVTEQVNRQEIVTITTSMAVDGVEVALKTVQTTLETYNNGITKEI